MAKPQTCICRKYARIQVIEVTLASRPEPFRKLAIVAFVMKIVVVHVTQGLMGNLPWSGREVADEHEAVTAP